MSGVNLEDGGALAGVLSGVVEAALEPESWDDVCDRMADYIGASAFMVFEYDLTPGKAFEFYGSKSLRTSAHTEVAQLVAGEAGEEEAEAYRRLSRKRAFEFNSEAEIYGVGNDADLPPSAFREAALRATGSHSRGGAIINDIGPWIDVAAIHYRHPSNDGHRSRLAPLLPVVGKAIETGRIIRALTRQWAALLDLFDRLDFGAAFCDGTGKVVLANRRLREIAGGGDALVVDGSNRLDAALADRRGTIRQLVAKALKPGARPGELIASLPRRSGGVPMIAIVSPTPSESIGWRAAPMLSLLLVIDPETSRRVGTDGLAALGVLSAAELEVCRHLVQGLTTADIAERRDTSVETTRSQIKAATAKLTCSGRLDLVRLALATQSPLREDTAGDGTAADQA